MPHRALCGVHLCLAAALALPGAAGAQGAPQSSPTGTPLQWSATARAGARSLRLSESADLWYIGGGAFEDATFGYTGRPSGGARGLATVFDLSLTVTPASWLTLEAFAALAPEGDVIGGIYPSAGTGGLGYLEVELRR
jgi:hypothetical protein